MKLRGGYNVPLAGRPAREIESLPDPDVLRIPRRSRQFHFAEPKVESGAEVRQGAVLAIDPNHHDVPLLAPRAGTVEVADDALVLRDLAQEEPQPAPAEQLGPHADDHGPAGQRRRRLVELGAWQFFEDSWSGGLPAPADEPRAVLVIAARYEPFGLRGDAQLVDRLSAFTRGLEHLQSLLEYQPIYLIVPDVSGELAEKVHETVRGHAYVKVVKIPRTYPYDHPGLLCRHLGLKRQDGLAWALRTEGVLAVDRAMTLSVPVTGRIVAVGGPGVERPMHVRAMVGYPIEKILQHCGVGANVRVLAGEGLTGEPLSDLSAGLDAECTSLTVLPETVERTLLGWGRPGLGEQSFAPYYLSRLRKPFVERLTTALRGERRACVACQLCERVCPAGIWPHLIHKTLYQDDIEGAEAARIDLCIECGLCAYVCPSKLELLQQFRDAKKTIAEELHAEDEDALEAAAGGEAGR